MSKVNIGGSSDDAFYRYKRDVIAISKAGKGMWKISNIDFICKQLKVGAEFAEKLYAEIKRRGIAMIGRGNFRGVISVSELEKIINKLIDKYVLCPKCKLPEWNGQFCGACGETKAIKGITSKDDAAEPECSHCARAAAYVKELYAKRLTGAAEEIFQYEQIIDYFWDIPCCSTKKITESTCEKKHSNFCKRYEDTFYT